MNLDIVDMLRDGRLAFYGQLALRLKPVFTDRARTMATDGRSCFINPEWYEKQNKRQRHYCWCHEVLHPALRHNARQESRDHAKWNVAGDAAIASILAELEDADLIERPTSGVVSPDTLNQDWGKTAEFYYGNNDEEPEEEPDGNDSGDSEDGDSGDDPDDRPECDAEEDADSSEGDGGGDSPEDGNDGGGADAEAEGLGDGGERDGEEADGGASVGDSERLAPVGGDNEPALSGDVIPFDDDESGEAGALEQEWASAVIEVTSQTQSIGHAPGWAVSEVEKIRRASGPDWKQVLRQFCKSFVRSSPSFSRPNRMHLHRGLILPSRRRDPTLKRIAVYCDSSGSHSDQAIASVLAQVESIAMGFDRIEVAVCWWDEVVHEAATYRKADFPLRKAVRVSGRGGTMVSCVFAHVKELKHQPDAVIVATDGFIPDYPATAPPFPMLWCMTNVLYREHYTPPFGQVVEVTQ